MLITLAELKAFGITGEDAELNGYVNAIDSIIQQATGRQLSLVTAKDFYYSGEWSTSLVLDAYPVTILHSFQYNENNLWNGSRVDFSASDYALDPDSGIIYLETTLPRGRRNIKVNITAGYDENTAPQDLKLACFALINEIRTQSASAGIAAESVDGASLTYNKQAMQPSTAALLAKYMSYDF